MKMMESSTLPLLKPSHLAAIQLFLQIGTPSGLSRKCNRYANTSSLWFVMVLMSSCVCNNNNLGCVSSISLPLCPSFFPDLSNLLTPTIIASCSRFSYSITKEHCPQCQRWAFLKFIRCEQGSANETLHPNWFTTACLLDG